MNWQLLIAILFLGFTFPVYPPQAAEPVSVDRLCGKLVSNGGRQEATPVSHARVQLFSPIASAECCELMTPVAEVVTGRDGEFQFKKAEPGEYWLVASIGGAEHKLRIRFEPGSKKSGTDCSAFQYTLVKGELQFRKAATPSAH